MRSDLQARVQRLEKVVAEQLVAPVAILRPVDGGYIDSNGTKYKKLEDCQAAVKIIDNIPMPEEMKGGDVD